jgi:hypothetical protein
MEVKMSQEIVQINLFKSMGFEVEGTCKVKGQSGLEYKIDCIAYDKINNHVVILNRTNYGEHSDKELLLMILDVGEALKKSGYNLSVVGFYPDIEIDLSDNKINEYKTLEEMRAFCLKQKEFKMYKQATEGFIDDLTPYFLSKHGVFSFFDSGHMINLHADALVKYNERKNQSKKFIENYGGLIWSINSFTPHQVNKICKAKTKEDLNEIKSYAKCQEMYSFFYPTANNFAIGVIKNKEITELDELKGMANKSFEIGHPLLKANSSEKINPDRILDIVSELITFDKVEKNIKYGLTKDGKQYYEININSKPQEKYVLKLLNNIVSKVNFNNVTDIIKGFLNK